jgi:hypothetical protein
MHPILSGYGFKITTDDLESVSLSSMGSLQMRWNLSRVVVLQVLVTKIKPKNPAETLNLTISCMGASYRCDRYVTALLSIIAS